VFGPAQTFARKQGLSDPNAALHQLSAREIAARVRGKALSATEVAQAMCARIERLNPRFNAFVAHDRAKVVAAAQEVDARLARGEALPLAGIPFSVKDNLWLADHAATFGSHLFAGHVAPRDSWSVARLRELGAVPLGVTACSEFACKGITNTLLHGRTLNPWDTTRTPGGSSGGAVAAVAAGLGPWALGTDAGGSTRRPAAHTGLVGFKCTLGAIPNPWGFEDPNHLLSVVGCIGREVEDVAFLFDSARGTDLRDPLCAPVGADMVSYPVAVPVRPPRVAYSRDLGCGFAVDADAAAAVEAAVAKLAAAGWQVEEVDPPWPAGVTEYPLIPLQLAQMGRLYGARLATHRHLIDPDLVAQIEAGLALPPAKIAEALMLRDQMVAAFSGFMEKYDLLLTQTAPVEAWPVDQVGPPVIGGKPAGPRGHAAFTPLFNGCGVPALSIPCGFGAHGLPLGMQLVGARYADARVLAAGLAAQRILGVDARCPVLAEV
jgi:aspartyl-tRNA(Asn)/glutamyl-tRNA(Gln) amidotransferase subunit A